MIEQNGSDYEVCYDCDHNRVFCNHYGEDCKETFRSDDDNTDNDSDCRIVEYG